MRLFLAAALALALALAAALVPVSDSWDGLLRGAGGGVLLAFALIPLWFRPLARVYEALGRVAAGDYAVRVPEPANELGAMAGEINRMCAGLAARSREREEFVARLTHDLRSPLQAISLHVGSVLGGGRGPVPEPLAAELRALERSRAELASAIDDVVELTRLESKPELPQTEPVDLRAALANAIGRAVANGVGAFDCHALPGQARASADVAMLDSALDQIIRVAAGWSSGQGATSVSVYRGGPKRWVVAFAISPRPEEAEAVAAIDAARRETSPAPPRGMGEVRWRRADRLAAAAGALLELHRVDRDSWSVHVAFPESAV